MQFQRASGILLHPSSLPGPWGIGDLGPMAYRFVDFLVAAGQSLWQVLPLGPTGYGDSPYQCFSAFAGNPLLISIDDLIEHNLLTVDEARAALGYLPAERVEFGSLIPAKQTLLRQSFERFRSSRGTPLHQAYTRFCLENAEWLADYALFMAIKEAQGGGSWHNWPPDLRDRKPEALARIRRDLAVKIDFHQYVQFLFFRQWQSLKEYANQQGVIIIGDAPIFVADDSADVWAHRDLFYVDAQGMPTVVAGVPPDYFSTTGQRWGNPLYRWDKMAATGYRWWVARMRQALTLYDVLRLDHFRGFEAYWEVPASAPTAVEGRWVKGPGADLFHVLRAELGDLPIIAEDLGLITPEVEELRLAFELPGMKVLHFAFGDNPNNPYLPHNYTTNYVVYTGTHDNDTTVGWFNTLDPAGRAAVLTYLGRDEQTVDIAWDLMRLGMMSVANYVITPLQDVLRLGSEARMNMPGRLGGNWAWRFSADALQEELAALLRKLTYTYGRLQPAKS
ncbi:MAG: 4-alpha-glucanotransferase [Chloroflexus sp.]|uniref:4-alpha-glucanotransferase n=1 Tax=Chloroflexus sp. TaxID=1904827 RepID=UPI0021DBFE15|nr:4-alpha-glucanotransferase [Chloroflexus sp.]GIV89196.1 MAG: 4-alpha-glucanotransferase [Chloroflexus sp.]